jgi:phosphonate transport system ATP-binding protein
MSSSNNNLTHQKTVNPLEILRISNLTKTYENGHQALKGISLTVNRGEFLVIVGLSGSGKSTLLRCINHLHKSTSGKIEFNGLDITEVDGNRERFVRSQIAMIFQHFNLIPRRSVLINVLCGRLFKTSTWRSILGLFSSQDRSDAAKVLKMVGLESKMSVRADELSGGQKQRVAIARALMQNPELLLADEPVASLDPATCHVVMDYLKKINQELGITVIANLHFLSLVRQYASRVIALKDGKIVFEGQPAEIDDQLFKSIYGEKANEVHIK